MHVDYCTSSMFCLFKVQTEASINIAYVIIHVNEENTLGVDSNEHRVVHLIGEQGFARLLDLTAEECRSVVGELTQEVQVVALTVGDLLIRVRFAVLLQGSFVRVGELIFRFLFALEQLVPCGDFSEMLGEIVV